MTTPPQDTDAPADHVLCRVEAGIAWITLNRPDVGNAITAAQRLHLIDLLAHASETSGIRVVVLRAAGRHFCTGADLRATQLLTGGPTVDPDLPVGHVSRGLRTGAQRLITAVLDCEKPVIAAVNGAAAGLGAHLAFASDLVLAADSARFIEVFVRRGIIPDAGGPYLLPRLIGLHKAKELMFFGDDLSAEDAHRLGLVNKVVPADDLQATTEAWAQRLATSPTRALSFTKSLLNRSLDSHRTAALYEESWVQELIQHTHDAAEGVTAFIERRPANFRGD
jgi:2-(1,2-epoxy-1,2-dihydrophenyl)acetyl-CoA isomerase